MNTMNLDALKADESALRKELESAGVQFRGRACRCPFHDDKNPSSGIFFHDGHWLFKCQVCDFAGSIIDVRARLNKHTPAEELRAMTNAMTPPPPLRKQEPPPRIFADIKSITTLLTGVEDEYSDLYADPETGEMKFTVIRWKKIGDDKKSFVQCFAVPGGWQMKKPSQWPKYPLANRAAIRDAETVVFVEGEKALRALAKIGIVATTTPGGAGKSDLCDLSPLAGKRVVLWPDNDTPDDVHPLGAGVQHMRQVRKILEALSPPASLSWIEPDTIELPIKGDAADFVSRYAGWTVEDQRGAVEDVISEAKPLGLQAELDASYAALFAGKMRSLQFGPWGKLTHNTKALMPGSVTMVCGDPGSTKSFFIIEAAQLWQEMGTKWCIYQLEEDHFFHMKRAMAQRVGDGRITDHDWSEAHAAQIQKWRLDNREWEKAFGNNMLAAPDADMDLDGLAEWIEGRARAGYEIIVADPITAVDNGKDPWLGERKFLLRIKRAARRYGSRIIIVTHPTKSSTKRDFGSSKMAGSTNFARFTQTILWMERCDEPENVMVRATFGGPVPATCNRKVHLLKTRNSIGAGLTIAFHFDPRTLQFLELGVIVPEKNE